MTFKDETFSHSPSTIEQEVGLIGFVWIRVPGQWSSDTRIQSNSSAGLRRGFTHDNIVLHHGFHCPLMPH